MKTIVITEDLPALRPGPLVKSLDAARWREMTTLAWTTGTKLSPKVTRSTTTLTKSLDNLWFGAEISRTTMMLSDALMNFANFDE